MKINGNNVVVSTDIEKQKKKQKKLNNIKANLAAAGASAAVGAATILPVKYFLSKVPQVSNKESIDVINAAVDKTFNEMTNLSKKGVQITNLTQMPIMIGVPELSPQYQMVKATVEGKNAFFDQQKNAIRINREKAPHLAFHEMGHAYNFNNSKFWKSMQKMKLGSMMLPALFASMVLCTKKSTANDGEELTKFQKIKNGIRDACPILATASMLPNLAEEGMASIRGCKWAKQLLDPANYKKVAKSYKAGFMTYAIQAAATGLSIWAAKAVKDHYTASKEAAKS